MRGHTSLVDGTTRSLVIHSQTMMHLLYAFFIMCAFVGVLPSRDIFVFRPF